MHKTVPSGGSLGRLLGPLLTSGLSLIGNVLKPLAKNVLIPLRLIAPTSATNAVFHKKIFRLGRRPSDFPACVRTLIISNDIMKIVKSLEESGLLMKGVREKIKNEAKEQNGGFLGMLLVTLDVSLLRNVLTVEGTIRTGEYTF